MKLKHDVADTDLHFVIDPSTRNINKQYTGKAYLMQHDHNSESLTFEVPRYIEEHDMSLCDTIQIHYENASAGTSTSLRQIYRDVETVKQENIITEDEVIAFSWLIPETATTFAGSLKFQLKFICHDAEIKDQISYRWHTNVNSDISIVAGLAYSESDLPASVKATLQTLKVVETKEGVEILLDGAVYRVYHGGYAEEAFDTVELKENKTYIINENSTDKEYPSAKAVREHVQTLLNNGVSVIQTVTGSLLKIFVGTKAQYEELDDKENLFAIISDDTTKQEIEDAIAENKAGVETNAKAIAEHEEAIGTHTTAIAENKAGVDANSTAIEEHSKHDFAPAVHTVVVDTASDFTIDFEGSDLTTGEVYLVVYNVDNGNYEGPISSGIFACRTMTDTHYISLGRGYLSVLPKTGEAHIMVPNPDSTPSIGGSFTPAYVGDTTRGILYFYKIGVI